MLLGWGVMIAALLYLGLLFAAARWGDRNTERLFHIRPLIYALSLGVYCTSWTFFGSVGIAASTGLDFIPVYIGPILLFAFGYPFILRVIRLTKMQNITSLADFMAARYGKDPWVAILVTLVCVVGVIPYIALQFKAVSMSLTAIIGREAAHSYLSTPVFGDMAFLVAMTLAGFAILFGTRHVDATEHQHGLIFSIALESIIKLIAFTAVGVYVTYVLFNGFGDIWERGRSIPGLLDGLHKEVDVGLWLTIGFLSMMAALLLPRQFHVAVVESMDEREVKVAAWVFPLYLIAINIFVIPIAVAGLLYFGWGKMDADSLMLALPMAGESTTMTLIAFFGGLSAATTMVIMACVALSIMISNEIVMPFLLRGREVSLEEGMENPDMGRTVLMVRRISIAVIAVLAYAYYQLAANAQPLASSGLISFAAVAQLAPAFIGGLIWRRGTSLGANAAILTGFIMWLYTLVLPSFAEAGFLSTNFVKNGLLGIEAFRPQALFGTQFHALTHGVVWSLGVNICAYVLFSLLREPLPVERLQANLFVTAQLMTAGQGFVRGRTSITVQDLKDTVARYLGPERTERAFQSFAKSRVGFGNLGAEADVQLLRHCEHLLTSAIGSSSARLVLSLLLRRRNVSTKAALSLLDGASAAIQYNRDLLQTALDEVRQGIVVIDRDLRLVTWNRRFRDLLDLPPDLVQIGSSIDHILRSLAHRGEFGAGAVDKLTHQNISMFLSTGETLRKKMYRSQITLEIRTSPMPTGGYVTTFADVTEQVQAEEALATANETLENRVRERTEQLVGLNQALSKAKQEADEANIGKTKFLAAAGHDIAQPLNAARLYVTSLVERDFNEEDKKLIRSVDQSLESVEEIISALLDISRLDAGALKPEISSFRLNDLFRQIEGDFAPLAKEKNLQFRVVPTSLNVSSDRRLLRRLLQNLVSNAIKYTKTGKVLLGAQRRNGHIIVRVLDTGIGIPESQHRLIFHEFQRLDQGARTAKGLGLGLSIVERIARVLEHQVQVSSRHGTGSMFTVEMPLGLAAPQSVQDDTVPARGSAVLDDLLVVCIDNEQQILDGMRALLTGWGCRVLTGLSLEAAREAIQGQSEPVFAVVSDYHLDESATGVEAIHALRQEISPDLPSVLITADRSADLRDHVKELGISLLNKPLKPAALRAVLSQLRTQKRS